MLCVSSIVVQTMQTCPMNIPLSPMEMRQVAAHFGKEVLREVALADFLTDMAAVREKAGDRATLRAYHFLKDNQRAIDEAAALEAGDFDKFLSLVKESGYSSFMYLQNVYVSGSVEHQEVAYTLQLVKRHWQAKALTVSMAVVLLEPFRLLCLRKCWQVLWNRWKKLWARADVMYCLFVPQAVQN